MKDKAVVPTGVERLLREGEYIISTTDTSGRITSANAVLMDYSGYTAQELLGNQHNIVRHPDMPRSVFWLAWETIRGGEDFHGYIKNLSRDGRHYWVHAHIAPVHDAQGEPTGYRSVRRKPKQAAVESVAVLYTRMREAEKAAGTKDAIEAGLAVLRAELASRQLSYEELVASL